MEYYKRVFLTFNYLTYLLYFVVYFNIWQTAPVYLNNINFFLKIYVSLVLLYFFHPFRKIKFDIFHRQLIFSAALFILSSVSLSAFIYHLKLTKDQVDNIGRGVRNEVKSFDYKIKTHNINNK